MRGDFRRESVRLPRQNRPVVRDGRLQPKRKRTDRRYLRPATQSEDAAVPDDEALTVADTAGGDAAVPVAPAPVTPAPAVAAPAASSPTAPARSLPAIGVARALQQQGVRKRREVDVTELLRRDSAYALHELRRIAILAALLITTLIVMGVVLR